MALKSCLAFLGLSMQGGKNKNELSSSPKNTNIEKKYIIYLIFIFLLDPLSIYIKDC